MLIRHLLTRSLPSLIFSLMIFSTSAFSAERIAPLFNDIIQQSKKAPLSETGARVVTRLVEVDIDQKQLATLKTYVAIRIDSAEAARDFSQIIVGFNSYFEELTLDFANISTVEGKVAMIAKDAIQFQSRGQNDYLEDRQDLVFSLPAVQVGSVLEFQYTRKEIKSVIPSEWFSRFTFYWWQQRVGEQGYRADPVDEVYYRLRAPQVLSLDVLNPEIIGLSFKKSSSQLVNGIATINYIWRVKDLPAFIMQEGMPINLDLAPRIYLSSIKKWQDIDRWAQGVIAPQMASSDEITQLAKRLSASARSREQKIKAVYEYVQKNVRYVFAHVGRGGYQPHTAMETLHSAYGDCKDQTVLTVTLLREMGIESYPALLSTKANGYMDLKLPSVPFDHMITYIPGDSNTKALWLDTTGDNSLFPGYHWSLEGQPALIINGKGGELHEALPRHAIQEHAAIVEMDFEYPPQKNTVDIIMKITLSGLYEQNIRSWWKYNTLRDKGLQQFVLQAYPSAEVVEAKVEYGEDLWQPVKITGRLRVTDAWQGVPSPMSVAFGLPQLFRLFGGYDNLDKPENRRQPYAVSSGYQLKMITRIPKPAKDYVVLTPTAGPDLNNHFFHLQQKSRYENNLYTVEITYEMAEQIINLDQYAEFYRQMDSLRALPIWHVAYQLDEKATRFAELSQQNEMGKTPATQMALAQFYIDNGEFDKALTAASNAVAANPNDGAAHYLLGMAQGFKNMFDESAKSFSRARELGYDM